MKKFLRILSFIIIVAVILIVTVLSYLTVDEYNPQNVETLGINGNAGKRAAVGTTMRLMTWNLGFGALGDNADFFMDGGKMVYTASKERVYSNLTGIMKEVEPENLPCGSLLAEGLEKPVHILEVSNIQTEYHVGVYSSRID